MTDEFAPLLEDVYRERAHLVAWLAAMHPAVIAPAPDVDEPGWQIVYLTAGGWQLSWHIAPRDADLFDHVERVPTDDVRAQWDGHTTDQKYARIRSHTRVLWNSCGRECSEMHTYSGRCELAPDDTDASEADVDAAMAVGVPVQIVTGPPPTYGAPAAPAANDATREVALPMRRRSLSDRLRYHSRKLIEIVNGSDAEPERGTLLGVAISLNLTADELGVRDDELAQARARVEALRAQLAVTSTQALDATAVFLDEQERLERERDRYRAAWKSARRRAAARPLPTDHLRMSTGTRVPTVDRLIAGIADDAEGRLTAPEVERLRAAAGACGEAEAEAHQLRAEVALRQRDADDWRTETAKSREAQQKTLRELGRAWARRRRYRAAWKSASAWRAKLRARCAELEQQLAEVRRFGELYATSCHVIRAETARDLLNVLDREPEAGRG